MEKIRLYVNTTKADAKFKAKAIKNELLSLGYEIVDVGENIVIGFGGDGTLFHFLKANNYNVSSSYIGVNCGTLGFLQDFNVEDVEKFVREIPGLVEQKLHFVNLELKVGGQVKTFNALNEFSVQNPFDKCFKIRMHIDGEGLNFAGTGLIFSTPTGSTALNLSAGGAILHPEFEAIQITPREAISNSKMNSLDKSICIPKGIEITLQPIETNYIKIISDGEHAYSGRYDSIKISYSDEGITKLKSRQDNFIKTIREKLI